LFCVVTTGEVLSDANVTVLTRLSMICCCDGMFGSTGSLVIGIVLFGCHAKCG
jgi:hypothetical protein